MSRPSKRLNAPHSRFWVWNDFERCKICTPRHINFLLCSLTFKTKNMPRFGISKPCSSASARDLGSATLGTRNLLFNHFQCTLPSNQTLLNHPRISHNSAEAIKHPINCQLASVPPTPVPASQRQKNCCRATTKERQILSFNNQETSQYL